MAKTIYADDMANALDYCDAPIEVLSLDCFDTLIWRTTPKPNDVFCELAPPLRRLSRMVADPQPISQDLLDRHFKRKHGPGAYYGQGTDH